MKYGQLSRGAYADGQARRVRRDNDATRTRREGCTGLVVADRRVSKMLSALTIVQCGPTDGLAHFSGVLGGSPAEARPGAIRDNPEFLAGAGLTFSSVLAPLLEVFRCE